MVQTGKMVYRINRAQGLPCLGKEDLADAMEGPQLIPSVGRLCILSMAPDLGRVASPAILRLALTLIDGLSPQDPGETHK